MKSLYSRANRKVENEEKFESMDDPWVPEISILNLKTHSILTFILVCIIYKKNKTKAKNKIKWNIKKKKTKSAKATSAYHVRLLQHFLCVQKKKMKHLYNLNVTITCCTNF